MKSKKKRAEEILDVVMGRRFADAYADEGKIGAFITCGDGKKTLEQLKEEAIQEVITLFRL